MANVTRIKVEFKKKGGDVKDLVREFNRKVNNSNIMHKYKEHQYYESKSEKSRRKRKASRQRFQIEMIERKLAAGEPVKAPLGVIKKILSKGNKREE